jgi:exopolysaccharide biosynthesis protein
MISRSQMNRQLYQMGGEGMQAGMQEGIMQMAPQEMQSENATSNAINASSFTKSRAATIRS